MKQFPRPVLQEWMSDLDVSGGMSSRSASDRIMDTLKGSTIHTQKEVLDKMLRKYFNMNETELIKILEASHPEKLV